MRDNEERRALIENQTMRTKAKILRQCTHVDLVLDTGGCINVRALRGRPRLRLMRIDAASSFPATTTIFCRFTQDGSTASFNALRCA